MMTDQKHSGNGRQKGAALVVVLSFVVLLTVTVVAYFARTVSNRQVANDSLNAVKSEQLARNALEVIVNDFKQEIINGSTAQVPAPTPAPPATPTTIYNPTVRANMVPMRSGNPAVPNGGTDPVPNLVRRSVRTDPVAAPGVPSRASAINTAANASVDGRVVNTSRWNKHFLLPQKDAAGSNPEPVTDFNAPDWVMMTASGPKVLTAPDATTVGRYAYAVYDEGGLLDANVAGFPSGTKPEDSGNKGFPALADLTRVPVKTNPVPTSASDFLSLSTVDQLVGWRHYATAQPDGGFGTFSFSSDSVKRYYTGMQTDINGYLKRGTNVWHDRTDQVFFSRQQLLSFQQSVQQASSNAFPSAALQHLGTFSRELNSPSWGPSYDAADSSVGGSATSPNTGYPYKAQRNATGAPNRFIPGVRYARAGNVTRYKADGTAYTEAVKVGDPLVPQRFPLSRLAWIGPNGPRTDKGGTDANIQACFGLIWAVSSDTSLTTMNGAPVYVWKYVGPTGTTSLNAIKTLGVIAQEVAPREPNFFELLNAGMLTGSLGLSAHPTETANAGANAGWFSYFAQNETWTEFQILRVGASIITQAQMPDTTYPTVYPVVIEYTKVVSIYIANVLTPVTTYPRAVGIDDLPYLNQYTILAGNTPDSGSNLGVYLTFGMWNPHQRTAAAAATTTVRPKIRLCVTGNLTLVNKYGDQNASAGDRTMQNTVPTVYNWNGPGYVINIGKNEPGGVARIELKSGLSGAGINGFADPHIPAPTDMEIAPGAGSNTVASWAQLPNIKGQSLVGYRLPDFPLKMDRDAEPPDQTANANNDLWGRLHVAISPTAGGPPFNSWLEFQTPAGTWIPYCYHAGIGLDNSKFPLTWNKTPFIWANYLGRTYASSTQTTPGAKAMPQYIDPPSGVDPYYYLHYTWMNFDPRSLRFNYVQGQSINDWATWFATISSSHWSSGTETNTTYPNSGRVAGQNIPPLLYPAGYSYGDGSTITSCALAGLTRNSANPPVANANTMASYKDPDGVRRLADSGLFGALDAKTNSWRGDPYALSTTRSIDRPLVLHRPFNNVAELGYVSRDDPWRTLDFFTERSADSGLLDLFTASQNTSPMIAGRINLNSRNSMALNAMLSGSIADIITDTTPTTPTQLSKSLRIAGKLAAHTASTDTARGPLISKDELALRFVPTLSTSYPVTNTPDGVYTSTSTDADFKDADEQNVKTRREAVTRAFAENGQTRTWNLLIDVVAQSGRFTPDATALTQFTVTGERHYWLHVAIDRFTGAVIDQQLEAVTE